MPEGITLDEHYDLAMETGMNPQEYVRRNYHGTSSYPHQAHILSPRRLVNHRLPTTTANDPVSDKPHQLPGFSISNPYSFQVFTKRSFTHTQEEEFVF